MGLLKYGKSVAGRATSGLGMKVGLGSVFGLGVASGIGSSVKEAAFDTAFDNPNADEAFMGRPMSTGFLGASATGGAAGAIGLGLGAVALGAGLGGGAVARAIPKGIANRGTYMAAGIAAGGIAGFSSQTMDDALSTYGARPSVGMNIATTGIGATVGGTIGALAFSAGGIKKAAIGGGIGAAIGGLGGAAAVPAMTASRVMNNRELLARSPYNSSLNTAQMLNASGDIVLGMHNSRGGY
jgi:hypothetical protein